MPITQLLGLTCQCKDTELDDELKPDNEMANSDDNDSQLDDEEPDPNDKQPPMINIEGKWRKWLKIVDKEGHVCKIWLKKILSISESLIGQRLIVWEGVIDSDIPGAEAVTIRDS